MKCEKKCLDNPAVPVKPFAYSLISCNYTCFLCFKMVEQVSDKLKDMQPGRAWIVNCI